MLLCRDWNRLEIHNSRPQHAFDIISQIENISKVLSFSFKYQKFQKYFKSKSKSTKVKVKERDRQISADDA